MEKLEKENNLLIKKIIKNEYDLLNERRSNQCFKLIIQRQATKLDAFKRLFWRIYWN